MPTKKLLKSCLTEFREYAEAEGLSPYVLNWGETGFFLKANASQNLRNSRGEGVTRASADVLTLLLCGNAGGGLKLKHLLEYHSELPGVFKRENVIKSKVSVLWQAST